MHKSDILAACKNSLINSFDPGQSINVNLSSINLALQIPIFMLILNSCSSGKKSDTVSLFLTWPIWCVSLQIYKILSINVVLPLWLGPTIVIHLDELAGGFIILKIYYPVVYKSTNYMIIFILY